jgi:caffeoyl-CoA O-methyltransferase
MFHAIPAAMLARMRELEAIDARDRTDGTPQQRRLRQVPATTGRFLAILAAGAPPGPWIEIGTSAGYSTLWLALAARARGARITTYEVDPTKVALARETFRLAGVDDVVTLVEGDARERLREHDGITFCFLDAEKDVYEACYDLVVPRLASGGLLVADNVISHHEALAPFVERALADERVDAVVVPIEKGELLCRRV